MRILTAHHFGRADPFIFGDADTHTHPPALSHRLALYDAKNQKKSLGRSHFIALPLFISVSAPISFADRDHSIMWAALTAALGRAPANHAAEQSKTSTSSDCLPSGSPGADGAFQSGAGEYGPRMSYKVAPYSADSAALQGGVLPSSGTHDPRFASDSDLPSIFILQGDDGKQHGSTNTHLSLATILKFSTDGAISTRHPSEFQKVNLIARIAVELDLLDSELWASPWR